MIRLTNLTKSFSTRRGRKYLFDDVSIDLPTGQIIALLGRNGAGKSTLLQMIAGTIDPDHGTITSDGSISWPVGFTGSFHRDLTGAQNSRFIARIYGIDTDDMARFVEDFARLGDHFHMPVRSYSSGMKARLAFGISMGVPFDTYLVDEVTSVGDAAFRRRSDELFQTRLKDKSALVVSHSTAQLRAICTAGLVLEQGELSYHDDLEVAIKFHEARMARDG